MRVSLAMVPALVLSVPLLVQPVSAAPHGWTTASVEIGDFRVQLLDLAPDDGVAPEIRFAPWGSEIGDGGHIFSSITALLSDGAENARQDDSAREQFAPMSATAQPSFGRVDASITGDGSFESMALAVSASAERGEFGAWSRTFTYFSLTPHTLVSFSARSRLSLTSVPGYTMAIAQFQVVGPLDASGLLGGRQEDLEHVWLDGSDRRWQAAGPHLVSFTNLTGADLTGYLDVSIQVNGVAAIPEPATAWLMAGGLAFAATGMRRRRRAVSTAPSPASADDPTHPPRLSSERGRSTPKPCT